MAYTSRCSGKTAEALARAGWRFILEARQGYTFPPAVPYAIDNGAWAAHTRGEEWDPAGFRRYLSLFGERADWAVLPDIVGGGSASLRRSLEWIPEVRSACPRLMLAVQDGMTAGEVAPLLDEHGLGLFLGGSTEWKLRTMRAWGAVARDVGCWFHVARVNTARRIRLCQDAGADSFDGSSPTRFRVTLRKLDNERRQASLFGGLE